MDLEWAEADAKALEKITKDKVSALLFFADEKHPTPSRSDVEDLSKKGLIRALTVAAKSTKASDAAGAVVPSSLLARDNLWTAYGVSTGGVYVLTDHFGNEVGRADSPKVRALALGAAKVLKARRSSVAEKSEAAKTALESKDFAKAFAELKLAFEHKLVGYSESEAAAKVYSEWQESARAAIASAKSDEALLKPLRAALMGTPLESEVPALKTEAVAKAVGESKDAEVDSEKHGE